MYRGSPFRSTWTWVTLGLGMCKVCTEAVHCVALWTRVTLGLGMCKVSTEAVHCVSSPLQAFSKWSPLQAPSSPLEALQRWPPSSPLEALFKPFWSVPKVKPLQAPFKPPWSFLQAPFKPPSPSEGFKPLWSPLQAALKPSEGEALKATLKPASSSLEAFLKPFKAALEPPWRLSKVKPPSSLREGYLQRVLRWRWSPLRHWTVPCERIQASAGRLCLSVEADLVWFLAGWCTSVWENDYVALFCFNSVTSSCGSWYPDCRALCPGPSSQEDRTLAARIKKIYKDFCESGIPAPWFFGHSFGGLLVWLCVGLWLGCGSFLGCSCENSCTQLGFTSVRISISWPTVSRVHLLLFPMGCLGILTRTTRY